MYDTSEDPEEQCDLMDDATFAESAAARAAIQSAAAAVRASGPLRVPISEFEWLRPPLAAPFPGASPSAWLPLRVRDQLSEQAPRACTVLLPLTRVAPGTATVLRGVLPDCARGQVLHARSDVLISGERGGQWRCLGTDVMFTCGDRVVHVVIVAPIDANGTRGRARETGRLHRQ